MHTNPVHTKHARQPHSLFFFRAQCRPTAPAFTVRVAPGPAHHGGHLHLLTWCSESLPPSTCVPLPISGSLYLSHWPSPQPTRRKFFQPHHSSSRRPSPSCWFSVPGLRGHPAPTPARQLLSGLSPLATPPVSSEAQEFPVLTYSREGASLSHP